VPELSLESVCWLTRFAQVFVFHTDAFPLFASKRIKIYICLFPSLEWYFR
jgi:hypothetical protein